MGCFICLLRCKSVSQVVAMVGTSTGDKGKIV